MWHLRFEILQYSDCCVGMLYNRVANKSPHFAIWYRWRGGESRVRLFDLQSEGLDCSVLKLVVSLQMDEFDFDIFFAEVFKSFACDPMASSATAC